jgi:hypothetical protein
MANVKIGDRVKVVDRELVPADAKGGLFYEYFRNLTGVVERLYDDDTICVDVDVESLPLDIYDRHKEMEIAARDKWIAGLSQEQRGRLTEQDKQFTMHYKIVLKAVDVMPSKGPAKTTPKASESGKKSSEAKPAEAKEEPAPAQEASVEPAPKRATQKDLNAAEREFLKELKARQKEAGEAAE